MSNIKGADAWLSRQGLSHILAHIPTNIWTDFRSNDHQSHLRTDIHPHPGANSEPLGEDLSVR